MLKFDRFRQIPIKHPVINKPSFSNTTGHIQSPQKHPLKSESSPNLRDLSQITIDQLTKICDLRKQLLHEKSKSAELEQKIDEMDNFITDYGLKELKNLDKEISEFCKGVPNYEKFRTQITLLNDTIHHNEQKLKADGNVNRVFDEAPVILELQAKGFIFNGEFRKYKNPLNASFLCSLSRGSFPLEIKEMYPNGVKINLIDNRKQPDVHGTGKNTSEESNDMEPLTTPEPIGNGKGLLKIRLPSGSIQFIHVEEDTTFEEIFATLYNTIGFDGYKLYQTTNNTELTLNDTVRSAGLYPRGIVNAKYVRKNEIIE